MPNYNGVWSLSTQYQNAADWPRPASTALFGGGDLGSNTMIDVIESINFNSQGNAVDFGNLSNIKRSGKSFSSSTRGVFAGGYDNTSSTQTRHNQIEYVTISTAGNVTDFGDLTEGKYNGTGLSNSTRGIIAGGTNDSAKLNVIEYVTIANTGNGTDFGDLSAAKQVLGGCASPTRGIFMGGDAASYINVIEYITIGSTGDVTDFGNLSADTAYVASASSTTRGLMYGGRRGSSDVNTIEYITIASTGNATDFGDRTVASRTHSASSNSVFACGAGGFISAASNVIDFVTIASTGNASDFGDLTAAKTGIFMGSVCSSHGGIA